MSQSNEISHGPNETPLNILGSVPFEKGFHFYTGHREYTGITATSLYGFVEKMQIINLKSVEYHARRHDFSTWIKNVIGDVELSSAIENIEEHQSSSEDLRNKIIETVHSRTIVLEKLVGGII
jgi:hypothetical protein